MIISSAAFRKWHKEMRDELFLQIFDKDDLDYPVRVIIKIWMPDRRRTDLTNKAESIMDLFVDCGILKDDSWEYVKELILIAEGVCKEEPKAMVEILAC